MGYYEDQYATEDNEQVDRETGLGAFVALFILALIGLVLMGG
jgi:hypothetical protein